MENIVDKFVVPEEPQHKPPHLLLKVADLFSKKATELSQLVTDTAEKVDTTVVKKILKGAVGYAFSLLLPVVSIIAVPITDHVLKKKQTKVKIVQNEITLHNQSTK